MLDHAARNKLQGIYASLNSESFRPSFAALRLYEHAVDAAGMTAHDDVEKAVIDLAKRRRVPVVRATLKVDDPSGALKEVSALPPLAAANQPSKT